VTARVAHLVRHPIKSAGYEPLDRVDLTAGRPFPFDRVWAVAHAAARLADPPVWAEKLQFLRGWASAELMAVSCRSRPDRSEVTLSHPRRPTESFRPDDPADAARLIDWLRPLWPETRPEPARVITVPGQAMTDMPDPYLAINTLSSLAEVARVAGQDLSLHRWRGNIWVEGWAPWAEFDLVGQDIAIGPVRLRVEQRIGRCRATGANPATGAQDVDTMGILETAFGHTDFGIYARVISGGTISLGDAVLAPC
jgi:hypothetical protein